THRRGDQLDFRHDSVFEAYKTVSELLGRHLATRPFIVARPKLLLLFVVPAHCLAVAIEGPWPLA
ncbi:hypothetical protein EV702DRAFT_1011764, partial [Suillus placidus]